MATNDNSESAKPTSESGEFDHTLNGKSFEQMSSDPEFTEEDLRLELAKYSKALKEEFETSIAAEPENVAEHSQTYFKAHVPSAIAQLVWLANNAESETVRMNASKYVFEQASKKEEADKDPVSALLRKLVNNDKKPQPTGGDSPTASAESVVQANKTPEEFLADEGKG